MCYCLFGCLARHADADGPRVSTAQLGVVLRLAQVLQELHRNTVDAATPPQAHRHRGAGAQITRGTGAQGRRGAGAQITRGTGAQGHRRKGTCAHTKAFQQGVFPGLATLATRAHVLRDRSTCGARHTVRGAAAARHAHTHASYPWHLTNPPRSTTAARGPIPARGESLVPWRPTYLINADCLFGLPSLVARLMRFSLSLASRAVGGAGSKLRSVGLTR